MDIFQRKIVAELSKDILLDTILKNKENLDTDLIMIAIKEFVKNHEKYDLEKKEILDLISEMKVR